MNQRRAQFVLERVRFLYKETDPDSMVDYDINLTINMNADWNAEDYADWDYFVSIKDGEIMEARRWRGCWYPICKPFAKLLLLAAFPHV